MVVLTCDVQDWISGITWKLANAAKEFIEEFK